MFTNAKYNLIHGMFDTNVYYILLPYRERENVESLLEQSLNTPSNGDGYPVIPFQTDGYFAGCMFSYNLLTN